MSDEAGGMPTIDPRWPRLLAAARAWRAQLIPSTSTGIARSTNVLIEAIDAFDETAREPPVPETRS